MASSDDDFAAMAPISLKDLEKMFMRKVANNERPYVAAVMRSNNELFQGWMRDIGEKLKDANGCVPAGKASISINLFIESRELRLYAGLRKNGLLQMPNASLVERWRSIFEETPLEELCVRYGSGCVTAGWDIIRTFLRFSLADYIWENFYSKSEDPMWYIDNEPTLRSLQDGYTAPFWPAKDELADYAQRVIAITSTPLEASK